MVDPIATVIIPNHNGMRFLPRLLESLAAQTERRHVVSIVDDASSDESAAYVQNQWPDVQLRRNERNLGFAGTCNAGLREARTPFVALLNNDTHVDPGWITEALRAFDADDVGSIASLVLLAEPPHLIDTAGDLYSVVGGALKRHHLMPRESAEALSEDCFSASGAAAFFRRDAIEAAGYLDEQFESYYEDVDLGFRLLWAGYRCRFAPRSICYHHLSSSYSPRGWKYHFNSARNAELVWRGNMPEALMGKHAAARKVFLAIQGLNKLRQGCFRAWHAGRRRAKGMTGAIERKRSRIPLNDPGAVQRVENAITRDWWSMHVSSRFLKAAPGDLGP